MSKQAPKAEKMFRKKFETFRELAIAVGEEQAFEKMLEGYPERQKKQLGAFIDDRSLADGFSKFRFLKRWKWVSTTYPIWV